MNSNILPSLIIAAAIVLVGFVPKPHQPGVVKEVFSELVAATDQKDASGDTQISKIFKGLSKSASEGFRSGFEGAQMEGDRDKMKVRDSIEIVNYKIALGGQKSSEKVIGTIKNLGPVAVANVQLNVMYKDKNGGLIDVSSGYSGVQGTLRPGDEVGFEIRRDLGSYNDKDDVLDARRAANVVVKVVDFRIVK